MTLGIENQRKYATYATAQPSARHTRPSLAETDQKGSAMVALDIGSSPLNQKHNFYGRISAFESARQAFLRALVDFVNDPAISTEDKWDEVESTEGAMLQVAKMARVVSYR
jgi:hypothetical protein